MSSCLWWIRWCFTHSITKKIETFNLSYKKNFFYQMVSLKIPYIHLKFRFYKKLFIYQKHSHKHRLHFYFSSENAFRNCKLLNLLQILTIHQHLLFLAFRVIILLNFGNLIYIVWWFILIKYSKFIKSYYLTK